MGRETDSFSYIDSVVRPFVKGQLCKETERSGRCSRFVLRHIKIDGSAASEVATASVPENGASPDEVDVIVNEIATAAAQDAVALGAGIQRYGVFAYFENLPNAEARCVLRLQGQENFGEDGADALDSEPVSHKGLVSQQMRHNEALMRNNIMAMSGIVTNLRKQNERLAQQNETLQGQHLHLVTLVEELSSAKAERDLESKRQEWKFGIQKEVLDKVKLFLPIMVNKVTGQKLLPEPVSPQTAGVRALIESLTLPQMEQLRHVLKGEQLLYILEAMQAEHNEQRKPEEDPAERKIRAMVKDNTGEGSAG